MSFVNWLQSDDIANYDLYQKQEWKQKTTEVSLKDFFD